MNADDLVLAYRDALKAQAIDSAAEAAADDNRKVVLSEQIVACGDVAVTKAEHAARASKPYRQALDALNATRECAENARAEVEYLRVRFEKWRTSMSMQKVMRQTNG